MAYCAIIIRDLEEEVHPFKYPAIDKNGNLVAESHDHGLNHMLTATGLIVRKCPANSNQWQDVYYNFDLELEFYVTDSRIIFYCAKFDKGDRKWSGSLTALALNAYEKAKANHRSKGKVLEGNVRYEWLAKIEHVNYVKRKMLDSNDHRIRLYYKDADNSSWAVETIFPKGTDTTFISNEIMHKAARYRIAMKDEKTEMEEAGLKSLLAQNIVPNENPKEFSAKSMLYFYHAPGGIDIRPEW